MPVRVVEIVPVRVVEMVPVLVVEMVPVFVVEMVPVFVVEMVPAKALAEITTTTIPDNTIVLTRFIGLLLVKTELSVVVRSALGFAC